MKLITIFYGLLNARGPGLKGDYQNNITLFNREKEFNNNQV